MPLYMNFYLCMFLLCVTGALSGALRRARIHPAVASFFMLLALFFSVFEDVQILPRLYANPGGFFVPMAGGILLLAQRPYTRHAQLAAYIVLTMLIGFLMGQVLESLTDIWFHGAPWIVFATCIVSSLLFCQTHHLALTCAVLSYYGAGLLRYFFVILPQGWVSLSLGSGLDALPCALLYPATLLACEVIRMISVVIRRRKQNKQSLPPEPIAQTNPVATETGQQSA